MFCFHDQGGYVAMAKRYRQYFAAAGYRKTLAEKAVENPAVNDLAGTTVFGACGSRLQESRQTADLIRSYGVDYLIPHIHWAEGASKLVRWFNSVHPKRVVENAGINDASLSR